jgi:hypothetical protein
MTGDQNEAAAKYWTAFLELDRVELVCDKGGLFAF